MISKSMQEAASDYRGENIIMNPNTKSPIDTQPYCKQCKKPMQFNVPRLGVDGGFVHADTGKFLCDEKDSLITDVTQVNPASVESKTPNALGVTLDWYDKGADLEGDHSVGAGVCSVECPRVEAEIIRQGKKVDDGGFFWSKTVSSDFARQLETELRQKTEELRIAEEALRIAAYIDTSQDCPVSNLEICIKVDDALQKLEAMIK